jgi:hypothetical protein
MQLKKRIYRITKMEHIPSWMATASLKKPMEICFSQSIEAQKEITVMAGKA